MLRLLASLNAFVSDQIELIKMETLPADFIDQLELLETATAMSEFSVRDQDLGDLETAEELLSEMLSLNTGKLFSILLGI